MKNIFYRIILYLDTALETDTYYNIALFMANNFSKIGNMKINELANVCFVSPATISRFCRDLGYENFAHLKQECLSFTYEGRKFNNLINIPVDIMKKNPEVATEMYTKQVADHVLSLNELLDWKEIDRVLKLIYDCNFICFFGTQFSQSAALHFQTDLLMLNKYSSAYFDSARQLESAKKLDENSVAIIITLNGNYKFIGHKTLQYIKKSQCKVVLLTCNGELDIEIPVHHLIILGKSLNNKTGKHALLTVVELMSLRYYCLYSPSIETL